MQALAKVHPAIEAALYSVLTIPPPPVDDEVELLELLELDDEELELLLLLLLLVVPWFLSTRILFTSNSAVPSVSRNSMTLAAPAFKVMATGPCSENALVPVRATAELMVLMRTLFTHKLIERVPLGDATLRYRLAPPPAPPSTAVHLIPVFVFRSMPQGFCVHDIASGPVPLVHVQGEGEVDNAP